MPTPALPVSPADRRYGRSAPPPMPLHRMLRRITPGLSPAVSLLASAGPVKNQSDEGSCTAHAGTGAMEWIFRAYHKAQPILSPQYLYACELLRQGNFPEDSGSDGQTLCESMIFKGCCLESAYPYVAGQILSPTAAQDATARHYAMGAYHGVGGSAVAASVLGDPVPWPLLIGFTVYNSFESDAVAATGIVPLPKPQEAVLGGHEVLCLGYDIGVNPTIRPQGCPPAFLIRNSWGAGWGLNGNCWMPREYFDMADTDIKIAHSGHPWAV